jgi:hypothetical protein
MISIGRNTSPLFLPWMLTSALSDTAARMLCAASWKAAAAIVDKAYRCIE